jgi:glycosyltransferase involved in cell wall biosynthesis
MAGRSLPRRVKVLAFPRDSNPYQQLLYGEMERLGAKVSYAGGLTPVHSLNVLLLPVELTVRRLGGARIVHLHWVWGFQLAGARRYRLMRRMSQSWFNVCLRMIPLLGMRLAWTAHNVLPHAPVFADDVAARKSLAGRCDVVFGHSEWTFTGLAELGAVPRRPVVVRHPPYRPPAPVATVSGVPAAVVSGTPAAVVSGVPAAVVSGVPAAVVSGVPAAAVRRAPVATASPTEVDGHRKFLFFGKILEYKGVEDLLQAFAALPEHHRARLSVVGECLDPSLRSRIEKLAREAGCIVSLRLQYVPDKEIGSLMAAADAVVLPFRRVTTSGSAILALAHGKPIVIPDLAALAELPDNAVFRYDGSLADLTATLQAVIAASDEVLTSMSAAAHEYSAETTWHQAALATITEFGRIL